MKVRPKLGRVMLRAAAYQFLTHHYGPIDIDEDFLQTGHEEIDHLKKQRHAPRLSDEYADD